jgi:hypothetical protein
LVRGLAHWPLPFEEFEVRTRYGGTHVVASGPGDAPHRICAPRAGYATFPVHATPSGSIFSPSPHFSFANRVQSPRAATNARLSASATLGALQRAAALAADDEDG